MTFFKEPTLWFHWFFGLFVFVLLFLDPSLIISCRLLLWSGISYCSKALGRAIKLLVWEPLNYFMRQLVLRTSSLELPLLCPRSLDALCLHFHSIPGSFKFSSWFMSWPSCHSAVSYSVSMFPYFLLLLAAGFNHGNQIQCRVLLSFSWICWDLFCVPSLWSIWGKFHELLRRKLFFCVLAKCPEDVRSLWLMTLSNWCFPAAFSCLFFVWIICSLVRVGYWSYPLSVCEGQYEV